MSEMDRRAFVGAAALGSVAAAVLTAHLSKRRDRAATS